MGTTVKKLIEKLSEYDPSLEVVLEHLVDVNDEAMSGQVAWDVIQNNVQPILIRIDEAQSNREDGDSLEEDYIECLFEPGFEDALDKKKVLVLSSEYFKYGEGE